MDLFKTELGCKPKSLTPEWSTPFKMHCLALCSWMHRPPTTKRMDGYLCLMAEIPQPQNHQLVSTVGRGLLHTFQKNFFFLFVHLAYVCTNTILQLKYE